jgi:hypothetical protein
MMFIHLFHLLTPVLDPNNVRMTKYPDNDPEFGHAITPPHYGCYDSENTTLSEFDKDLDFIL